MPITINTNVSALTAQRNLAASSARSGSSLSKLSSGSRVPTARDDAASLSVGTGLRLDVEALRAAQVNAQQGTSVLQIADGAFGQIADILTRMKSLATSAQSGQLSATELGFLDQEYQDLGSEIDRIAQSTEFNGVKLLGGSNTVVLDEDAGGGGISTGITVGVGAGANIAADNGFVNFTFENSVGAGTLFTVGFEDATNRLTIGRLAGASGTNIVQAQTLTVATPTLGTTQTYEFDDLGVTITLNEDFSNFDGGDRNLPIQSAANFEFGTQTGASAVQADIDFQVGIAAGDVINIAIDLGDVAALFTNDGAVIGDLTSSANAALASTAVDNAANLVNEARASLGATLNRLDFANSNISVAIENTEAARSVLMDVDVSAEITKFTSEQVLIQAGVSMLAQANQQPSLLLRLLQ